MQQIDWINNCSEKHSCFGSHLKRAAALLAAFVSLSVAGCGWVFDKVDATVLHRATIRVDGRDYTSEAVFRSYTNRFDGRGDKSAWGSVLAFRLHDDRVVVLVLNKEVSWACAPRIDGSATGCSDRWKSKGLFAVSSG